MPGDNPILRHWEAQRKLFRDNLFSLRDQMTVDEIHDLRVAIKKLRSYTKLHAALFNNKSNEQIPALRNLFGVLGKHRNMDIAQKLLISFSKKRKAVGEPLLVYLQLTQDQITPFCQQTVRAFTEEELDKFTNELNQDLENPYSPDVAAGVRNLIASGITVVKQDMHHFKKRSHLIRKHLKDMFYWSHLFEEQIFFTKPELKTLDKILDHLGTVQDHEVLIKNLKNFRKTILADSMVEYDEVKQIENDAEKKKQALLNKAHRLTESLISKDHKS